MKTMRYYYKPDTGIFFMRSSQPNWDFPDAPYIEREAGWRYDQHIINTETGEIQKR